MNDLNNETIQQPQSSGWGKTLFLGFTQLLTIPVFAGGLLLAYELSVTEESSLWVKFKERFAEGEVMEIFTAAPSEAWKEQLFQVAVAEIERVNQAYQALWQANSQIMVLAYQMEDKVLQSQIKVIEDSYGATKFATNMGDLGCALGSFLGDPYLATGCDFAEDQRVRMAREIKQITESHRSSIPQQVIDSLPKPDDLKIDKQRLADLMGGIGDA